MIRIAKILLASVLLFAGCAKPDQQHSTILPKEKMIAILTDMQLAEAATDLRLMPDEYLRKPEKWYVEIMEAHQTDTATFSASLRHYIEKPDEFSKMYDEVNKNLMEEIGMTPPPPEKSKK